MNNLRLRLLTTQRARPSPKCSSLGWVRCDLRRWLEKMKWPSIGYRGETIALHGIPPV